MHHHPSGEPIRTTGLHVSQPFWRHESDFEITVTLANKTVVKYAFMPPETLPQESPARPVGGIIQRIFEKTIEDSRFVLTGREFSISNSGMCVTGSGTRFLLDFDTLKVDFFLLSELCSNEGNSNIPKGPATVKIPGNVFVQAGTVEKYSNSLVVVHVIIKDNQPKMVALVLS